MKVKEMQERKSLTFQNAQKRIIIKVFNRTYADFTDTFIWDYKLGNESES
jgi:hypothetical protein